MINENFSKPTLIVILFIFCMVKYTHSQNFNLISPCPKLFKYDGNSGEIDKWFGTVTLRSEVELSGVWLRLIFDKPSIQLGNWFGEVVTTDNKEYLIKNRNHKLPANTPFNVKFYIKFNTNEPPPQLVSFRLNAKTVCPEDGLTNPKPAETSQQFTSSVLSTTRKPVTQTATASNIGNSNTFSRPGGGFKPPRPTDDSDFFQGDLSFLLKPQAINPFEVACGTVVIPPKPLITHGQATNEGEFPWHAALYHSRSIDLTYICGASLISKYHVITVAHCVTKTKSQTTLNPDNFVLYFGKFYLKRWSNPGIQDKHVNKITVHPQYDPQTYTNDLAILKLESPVQITNYVRPVCLWDEDQDLKSVIDKSGTVVGWGFDETGRVTEELTKAHMPVVSQETCIYSFPDFFARFTSEKTYCAGFRNDPYIPGTSVCNGDSGGGMVFPKSTSDPNRPVWQLRGLVSISVALQNQFKCDSTHYVVFTDLAKYSNWIKNNLK